MNPEIRAALQGGQMKIRRFQGADREILEVEFEGLQHQRLVRQFSSNWNPRHFHLTVGRWGELVLEYVVSDLPEQRARIVDWPKEVK